MKQFFVTHQIFSIYKLIFIYFMAEDIDLWVWIEQLQLYAIVMWLLGSNNL